MHGLAAICHEAPKGGDTGSRWPTHWRALSLLDNFSVRSSLLSRRTAALQRFALAEGSLHCCQPDQRASQVRFSWSE
jgi:hypothetical protein